MKYEAMEINTTKLDELYMKWCGTHHTVNSNKAVHDSAECTDFAEFVLSYAMREGKPDSDTSGGLHLACVNRWAFALTCISKTARFVECVVATSEDEAKKMLTEYYGYLKFIDCIKYDFFQPCG